MKKFFATIFGLVFLTQSVFAFSEDTEGWVDNTSAVSVNAVEIDLKSDLKSDFRIYQVTAKNKTNSFTFKFLIYWQVKKLLKENLNH